MFELHSEGVLLLTLKYKNSSDGDDTNVATIHEPK